MKTVAAADLLEARTFGQWFCCDSKRDDSAAAKKTGTYDTDDYAVNARHRVARVTMPCKETVAGRP